MNDFDDFDIGPQCDEYGDDYPYDDDEDFCGICRRHTHRHLMTTCLSDSVADELRRH